MFNLFELFLLVPFFLLNYYSKTKYNAVNEVSLKFKIENKMFTF